MNKRNKFANVASCEAHRLLLLAGVELDGETAAALAAATARFTYFEYHGGVYEEKPAGAASVEVRAYGGSHTAYVRCRGESGALCIYVGCWLAEPPIGAPRTRSALTGRR